MEEEKKSTVSILSFIGILILGIVIGGVGVWATINSSMFSNSGNIAEENTIEKNVSPHIIALNEAVQESPEDSDLWVQLANAYFDENNFKKAIVAYEKAVDLRYVTPELFIDYGTALRAEGRLQESLQQYNKALLLEPEYPAGLYNKGLLLYYDLEKKEDAFATWKILIKKMPNVKTPDGQLLVDFLKKLQNSSMAPTLQ